MRVVLAIFLIGGLVIALAYAAGDSPAPTAPPAALGTPSAPATAPSAPGPSEVSVQPRIADQGPTCAPGAGPAEIVAVPADVQARVDSSWSRIEGWLSQSLAADVVWNPPAADAAIARAQRAAGVAFPPDLVASLRRHDGVRAAAFTFPPRYAPMSTGEIGADAGKLCAAQAGWDGTDVPFARDSGGWYLYLDRTGGVGEHAPGGQGDTAAPSLAALLERTADLLEGRRPDDRFLPAVDPDGALSWRLR